MVKHFLIAAGKLACGRNNNNTASTRQVGSVTCKTCINTEAFKSAQSSDDAMSQTRQVSSVTGRGLTINSAHQPWQEPSTTLSHTKPTFQAHPAFDEWRYKLEGGDRLPRGKFFSRKGPALKGYQVGDCDIVAAFTRKQAIAVFCEQSGFPKSDYSAADVERVSAKTLDSLQVFNIDEGVEETLATSLRQDIAALSEPSYMYGWE